MRVIFVRHGQSDLSRAWETSAIIAVTHGGTLTFIYYLLLRVDLDKVQHIGNAAIHVFNLTEEKGEIRAVLDAPKKQVLLT